MSKYWVEHETYGCPIGGPFDLWRQNYFMAKSEPPEDTAKLYPGLRPETVTAVAVAARVRLLGSVAVGVGIEGEDDASAVAALARRGERLEQAGAHPLPGHLD